MQLTVKAFLLAAMAMSLLYFEASAATPVPPHLSRSGVSDYHDFIEAPDHRAFAVAPGGAWGWSSGKASAREAEEEALAICQGQTEQPCVSYAVDNATVFDGEAWPKLWRPYASAAAAKAAKTGRARGQRMYDLAYTDAQGKRTRLSSLRGKVVVLHFWGAWCPPCRREMPDLQDLYRRFAANKNVAFVILQAREVYAVSKRWAKEQGIDLPLADSGSQGELDGTITLADGSEIRDREISNRFPTTYVVDRHGVVVFSHVGPIDDWSQYDVFLNDLIAQQPR